jgi:histidinol-phosphate aminotransferase
VAIDVEALLVPHVRTIEPYAPIVPFDVLSKRLGRPPDRIVKLDANENPYGFSPRALEALTRSRDFHIYPDPEQTALRDALSAFTGIPREYLLCGAGADEVIDLVARAFVGPGEGVVDLPPTFGMYVFEAGVLGARYLPVPRHADFSVDVAAVEACVEAAARDGLRPKLLFLATPNNPDGSLTPKRDILRLLELPLMVVVDEAYIDFSGEPSLSPLVARHDNLVVLRTFSKLAGMAGLRVGYGVVSKAVIPHLWKMKQPYTPNVAGTVAAIAAMGDRAWLEASVRAIVTERVRLVERLREIGWITPLPSSSNFVLCRVKGRGGLAVKRGLENHGVLVRYFDRDGLRDCIRVSVGKPEHTDALFAALRAIAP